MSKSFRTILVSALAAAAALALSACGQKGDLYLPTAKAVPSAVPPSPALPASPAAPAAPSSSRQP